MASITIYLCHDIEQEWLHIIVKCLVIDKHLAQQTEILAVNLHGMLAFPIHKVHFM